MPQSLKDIVNNLLKDIFEAKIAFNEFKLKFEKFKRKFPKNIDDIVILDIGGRPCFFTLFSYACHCYIHIKQDPQSNSSQIVFHTLILKLMMKSGVVVDAPLPTTSNFNPLHYAVSSDCLSLVQLLCENSKPNLNILNEKKLSPVWVAVGKKYEDIAIYLLKQKNLDVNLRIGDEEKKSTLLHYILGNLSEAVLDEILKREDLNVNCEMLNTSKEPMNELIVTFNDIKDETIVFTRLQKLLARKEIDPFKSMSDKHSAYSRLFTWQINNVAKIQAMFEEYYKNNYANSTNHLLDLTTLLPIGFIRGSEYFQREITAYFLTRDHEIKFDVNFKCLGVTALFYAASLGLVEVVTKLIMLGADANIECNNNIALSPAIKNRHELIVSILLPETRVEKINKMYIFEATNIKTGNSEIVKSTLLHMAVKVKSFYIVQLLLQKGADPNIQDSDGLIPFATLPKREPAFYSNLFATLEEDLQEKYIHIALVDAGIKSKLPAGIIITDADVINFLIKQTDGAFQEDISKFIGLLIGKYMTDKNYLHFFHAILTEHPKAFPRFKKAVEMLVFSDVKTELTSLFTFFEVKDTVFETENTATQTKKKNKKPPPYNSQLKCWGLAQEKPKQLPAKWFDNSICSDSSAITFLGHNHYFYYAEKALQRQGCSNEVLHVFRNESLRFGENVKIIPNMFLQDFLINKQPYKLSTIYLFSCKKSEIDLIIYKWKERSDTLYIAAGCVRNTLSNKYQALDPIVIDSDDFKDELVEENNYRNVNNNNY